MEALKEPLGFVGLGAMGQPMARHLVEAGYALRVYNRDPRKMEGLAALGAHPCLRPGEVATPGGIVLTMVSDDAALEAVTLGADGILEHLGPGGIHLVMSVISPAAARTMTELHRQRHCAYVAAPVFGRPDVAAARQLWICLAGEAAAKARVQPILQQLGRGTFDFGEDPANTSVVKICGTVLIASTMEAISSTLDLAEQNGLDRQALIHMLTQTFFACSVYQDYGPLIAEHRLPPSLWERLKSLSQLLETS